MITEAASAASLAIFVTLASGWGRLVPTCVWADPRRSVAPRDYVCGFVLFSSLFAVAAQVHLPLPLAIAATVIFATVGGVGLLRTAFGDRRAVLPHAVIGLGIATYWIVCSNIAGNAGAIDPYFYAASPFVFFRWDWLTPNVAGLPGGPSIVAGLQVLAGTRASASAVLWPAALLGDGLGVGHITEAGIGLLAVAGFVCADLVPRSVARWVAIAIGVGGVGVYNAIAILSGGQVQQAVALLMVLACMWLARACASEPAAAVMVGVGGFAVSASYPEFLVALPIYIGALAVLRDQRLHATLLQVLALIAGFGTEQILTGGASLAYLLDQSAAAPGWAPLPRQPESALEVAIDLVLHTRPPVVWFALAAIASGVFWVRWRDTEKPGRVPRHALALLALGLLVCVVALIRTSNLDYAVFKLGGWLGPAVLLVVWRLVDVLSGQARRLAQAVLVLLALSRSAALVYGGNEVLQLGRAEVAQQWPRQSAPSGGCVVVVDTSAALGIVASIGGSAAPFHNCSLSPSQAGPTETHGASVIVPDQ